MKNIALKIYNDLMTYFEYDHKTEITCSELVEFYGFKVIDLVVLICYSVDFDGLKFEFADDYFKFFEGEKKYKCKNFKVILEGDVRCK